MLQWNKLPYLNGDIDALLKEMLLQTTQTSRGNTTPWHNQHSGKFMTCLFIAIVMLIVSIAFLIWYVLRSMNGKITIALPTVNI